MGSARESKLQYNERKKSNRMAKLQESMHTIRSLRMYVSDLVAVIEVGNVRDSYSHKVRRKVLVLLQKFVVRCTLTKLT